MPYAAVADVLARAGRIAAVFAANETAGKHPSTTDVTGFLTTVSAEIDLEIRRAGYDPAVLDASALEALKDVAAYGALARALAGVDPSSRPDNLDNLVKRAESVWSPVPSAARSAMLAGIFSVLAALEAGAAGGGAGSSAGSFLDDSPVYGSLASEQADRDAGWLGNTQVPAFKRGQSL